MTISAHVEATADSDGVRLAVKRSGVVLPPAQARELAQLLLKLSDEHDPLGVTPLPEATVRGDSIKP